MKPISNFVVGVNVQQPSRLLSRKNVLLSCLLLIGIFLGTTDAAFAGSTSVANPVTTAPLSPKEFADLFKAKKVNDWLPPGSKKEPPVVNLSPRECRWLGGTVSAHDSCSTTKLQCTGSNGNSACITELD
jgi:hypothetical protein